MGPRDVLNKLKWHPDMDLVGAKITIRHRGAPGDRIEISGENILNLGSGFMRVKRDDKTVQIPYHRVLKIESSGGTIWSEKG